MKAPVSKDIARVLRDSRSARSLVNAVLKERSSLKQQGITITTDGVSKRYKPVAAIQRSHKS